MCSETRTFERMPDWRRARVLWQQSPDFHRTLQRRRWPATDPAIPQPEVVGMRSWPANPSDGLLATRKPLAARGVLGKTGTGTDEREARNRRALFRTPHFGKFRIDAGLFLRTDVTTKCDERT